MKLKLLDHDSKYRTQDEAIKFHNDKGEVIISVADTLKFAENKDKDSIDKLRKDFEDYWLMTSTRIDYTNNTITHHFGSLKIKSKVYKLKEIPVCQPTYLKDLLDSISGLDYVRALVDKPKASKEQLISLFESLSGKDASNIRFWTPNKSSRESRPVRSVMLNFSDDWFVVGGGIWVDYDSGFSRGVQLESAKQTRFFSKKAIFDLEEKLITLPLTRDLKREILRKQKQNKKVKIDWSLKAKVS